MDHQQAISTVQSIISEGKPPGDNGTNAIDHVSNCLECQAVISKEGITFDPKAPKETDVAEVLRQARYTLWVVESDWGRRK